MKKEELTLTEAEWEVMECLWEKEPRTGREAAECLEVIRGWSRSTTLTLLKRLEKKNAVRVETENGKRVYWAAVKREDAALQQTQNLLQRVYQGSLSLMVSQLTRQQTLTQEEIDELYAVLKKVEEEKK